MQQLPQDVLQHALQALEAASGGAAFQHHSGQLADWKTRAGNGLEAVQIGLYCLQHSTAVRPRWFALSLLTSAAPSSLARGLLPVQDLWNIRTQLLHQAIAFRSTSETRLLVNFVVQVIGTMTVAGFALQPEDAHVTENAPRGFSTAARAQVLAQLDALLKPPTDAASTDQCHVGLTLASELMDRFDDRNALGALKLRHQTETKSLSWPEQQKAKQLFAEHLLPPITSYVLRLIAVLVEAPKPDPQMLEFAISALSAALDFHHEGPDRELARQQTACLLPGAYSADLMLAAGEDGDEVSRPPAQIRPLNSAMAGVVLREPIVGLLSRSLVVVQQLNSADANGATGDEAADEDDAALAGCRSCIEALASFQSPSAAFTSSLLSCLAAQSEYATRQDDVLFLARVLRLILALTPSSFFANDNALLGRTLELLHSAGQRTMRFFTPANATDLDSWNEAERVGMEAFEEVCDAWLGAMRSFGPGGLSDQLRQGAAALFTTFLDARLEGARMRALYEAEHGETEDEDVKAGYKDQILFRESLLSLALLARAAPETCLPHLNKAINHLSARMLNLVFRAPNPADPPNEVRQRRMELEIVHEQTHWAILIAGFVLADEGAGETPMVPDGLLAFSRAQASTNDDLILISQSVLHLFDSLALEHLLAFGFDRSSTLIAEDLFWCLGRWTLTYLLPDPSFAGIASSNLQANFSGDKGLHTLHVLLSATERSICQWAGEPGIVREAAAMISSMAKSKSLCANMVRMRSFAEMIEAILKMESGLDGETLGALWSACLRCVSNCLDVSEGRLLFDEIIRAIESNLPSILHNPRFKNESHLPIIIGHVNSTLDIYGALVSACQPNTTALVIPTCVTFCPVALSFLSTYDDELATFEPALAYFDRFATLLSEGFVDAASIDLHTVLHSMLQAINATVAGIKGKDWDAANERDLTKTLLSIVTGVVVFGEGAEPEQQPIIGGFVSPALQAMSHILTPSLLDYPYVLQQCVRAWRACLRVYPHAVAEALSSSTANGVRSALAEGLTASLRTINEDDVRAGLEACEALASAYGAHHLVPFAPLVSTVLRLGLTTLCYEPFAAGFAIDYIYLVRLCLLGLTRFDPTLLSPALHEVVAKGGDQSGAAGEAVTRLVALLQRGDALEISPRNDRGKLAVGARDEAFAILRELRLQVRL